MATRRGFTLIELLVAMVLLAIVGGATIRLLVSSQRLSRRQSEQVLLQGNVRSGALLVPSELRELSVTDAGTDIVSMAATAITYRALRSSGAACQVTAGAPGSVRLRSSLYFGYRTLAATRDSLLIFMDADPNITTDDRWGSFAVTGTPTVGTCPDGRPALVVPAIVHADSVAFMQIEAPVRSFEVMQLALFQQDAKYWLGARSVSADPASTLQPVLGPLTANGLEIYYYAANGATTVVANRVRTIDVMLRGLTQHATSIGSGATDLRITGDSLLTRIRLRNAPAI